LSKLFSLAFDSQSKLELFTSSTDITSFAQAFAKIIQIVPVHPYKSKTV
jgi:hypothetical protein